MLFIDKVHSMVFVDHRVIGFMVDELLSQSSGGYIYGYSEHLHFKASFVVEGQSS